jgi:hypothetical protein
MRGEHARRRGHPHPRPNHACLLERHIDPHSIWRPRSPPPTPLLADVQTKTHTEVNLRQDEGTVESDDRICLLRQNRHVRHLRLRVNGGHGRREAGW